MNLPLNGSRDPLHLQIAACLRRELAREGEPGSRFPSQNKLAERFGVSPLTAREAVGLLVQEGLLERRFGSGTYVTDRHPDMALAIVVELDISHPQTSHFYLRLIQRLRQFFRERGLPARLYPGHSGPHTVPPPLPTCEEFWTDLRLGRVQAVMTIATQITDQFAQELSRRDVPLIHELTRRDGKAIIDYSELIRNGVKAIAEQGCKRIALLDHFVHEQPNSRKRNLFVDLVRDAGMKTCPEWMQGVSTGPKANDEDGGTAFRRIWQARPEHPDGLLVLDDYLYRELCPVLLYNQIRVPDDLVVATHANRGDIRGFAPMPIRLEIDPDEVADTLGELCMEALQLPMENPIDHPLPLAIRVNHSGIASNALALHGTVTH